MAFHHVNIFSHRYDGFVPQYSKLQNGISTCQMDDLTDVNLCIDQDLGISIRIILKRLHFQVLKRLERGI
jgi:hypothetical protein